MIKKLSSNRQTNENLISKILKQLAFFFLGLYRTFGTTFFGGACRFTPSCSEYAQQALKTHTLLKALSLIFRRLGKCQPWGSHGHDPVPKSLGNIKKKASMP